jgi:hypothetical protein
MEALHAAERLNRSLVAFDQNSTIVAVVELSLKRLGVSGAVTGMKRQPVKTPKSATDGFGWGR